MIVANLTTIIANLALAKSVNYVRKVCCKLKRTFTIVNYNSKLGSGGIHLGINYLVLNEMKRYE